MLGCCNNFLKCSDTGKCIYEGDLNFHGLFNYNECLYKENIDKGLNFYTKYNENNRRRAEEYKIKKENSEKDRCKTNKDNIAIDLINRSSNETYIEIPNRLFSIGKRSKYNVYTYRLTDEERGELISTIGESGILCTNIENQKQFIDEAHGDNQRCNCKVVISLNGQKYNISNYNNKGLRKDTAIKVASYLIKNSVVAEIEEISNFSGSKIIKSLKTKEDYTISKKNIEKDTVIKDIPNYGQISFFDIQKDLIIRAAYY